MKYTKEFEKYWWNTRKSRMDYIYDVKFHDLEDLEWDILKQIIFRAWKAGIDKTKRDYNLIKPRDESPKFLPF
jgi:hypothetical protein